MNVSYAYYVRVRSNGLNFQGSFHCLIFCLLNAGATSRSFHATAIEAFHEGQVDMAAVVTDRRIGTFIWHGQSVAILAFQRPAACLAFGRQHGAAAVLGRSYLLPVLRDLSCYDRGL